MPAGSLPNDDGGDQEPSGRRQMMIPAATVPDTMSPAFTCIMNTRPLAELIASSCCALVTGSAEASSRRLETAWVIWPRMFASSARVGPDIAWCLRQDFSGSAHAQAPFASFASRTVFTVLLSVFSVVSHVGILQVYTQ